ncbi:MAG: 3-methyl-2-oxobutanoate hydroxymethyltransferase [Clostridia bacterium]|nr:3-methyl-2-oxobutanoate hydroxymethyltransferase [Clostridia bacterium]
MAKVTVATLREKKKRNEKITMVTAYDFPSAQMVEEAGLDTILVGDSLGMAVLGYETTLPVTMDEMIYHTKAVTRGAPNTFVVADMPFLSYHRSLEETITNAGRFLQEGGAKAVKLEGGKEQCQKIRTLVEIGIPVLGHIGLTPQSVHQLGGFKVQGKGAKQAQKLLEDAKSLEDAGAFAVVLECVPAPLAALITQAISIPTIGIGAGAGCDGQVLVWHDLLGMSSGTLPRFVKQYADLRRQIVKALGDYKNDVETSRFPEEKHSFIMDKENLPRLDPDDKE